MAEGLFDILPAIAKVKLGSQEMTVGGLSFAQISTLASRFPKVASLLSKRSTEGIEATELAKVGSDAIGAVIAIGFGLDNDEKAEKAGSELQVWQQIALLTGILSVTMRGEADAIPFVEEGELAKAMNQFLQTKPLEKSSSGSSSQNANGRSHSA